MSVGQVFELHNPITIFSLLTRTYLGVLVPLEQKTDLSLKVLLCKNLVLSEFVRENVIAKSFWSYCLIVSGMT
jgi:hypothetical protein